MFDEHRFTPNTKVQSDRHALGISGAPDGSDELFGRGQAIFPTFALRPGPGLRERDPVELGG